MEVVLIVKRIPVLLSSATRAPLYPFLVAALPVIRFYGRNFRLLPMRDNLPLVFIYWLVTLGLLATGRLVWKSWSRAALVLAPLLAVLFSGQAMGAGVSVVMLVLTMALGVLLAPRSGRLPWPDLPLVNLPLNAALLVLAAWPLVAPVTAVFDHDGPRPSALFRQDLQVPDPVAGRDLPDVYFLLVDGLGQPDFLEQVYGLPDAEYTGILQRRGFRVMRHCYANYPQTALSLSGTLNAAALPEVLDIPDRESRERRVLDELAGRSRVARAFARLGYRIVSYPSGYPLTRFAVSDQRHQPAVHPTFTDYYVLNDGCLPLLSRLLGKGPAGFSYALRRGRLHYILDHLDQARRGVPADKPVFVFAHILAPHPPFVFRDNGKPVPSKHLFAFADGSHWYNIHGRDKPLYRKLYSGQARYIMKRLGETVDRILAASPRPPVIIIQGDHGPGSELDWDRPRQTNHNERMGIYNAWLTPPGIEPALYEGMTAVNTFPLLFNAMTGSDLPLRPDEAWFATMKNPYIFHPLKFEPCTSENVSQ